MNGMEMMIPHLIKGLGLDPEKIKEVLTDATTKVTTFDKKLSEMQYSIGEHTKLLLTIGCALQRLEMKFNTLPDEELTKILASMTPEQIAKGLEEAHGRNGSVGNS